MPMNEPDRRWTSAAAEQLSRGSRCGAAFRIARFSNLLNTATPLTPWPQQKLPGLVATVDQILDELGGPDE